MKTIKQILESHNIKEDTLYHNYSYLYESIVKAMEEFGSDCFNMGQNGTPDTYYNDFEDYLKAINNGQD